RRQLTAQPQRARPDGPAASAGATGRGLGKKGEAPSTGPVGDPTPSTAPKDRYGSSRRRIIDCGWARFFVVGRSAYRPRCERGDGPYECGEHELGKQRS